MNTTDFISVLTSLMSLSVASGLIFAILVQPLRTETNLYFALFAFSVGIWSFGAIVSNLNQEVVVFTDKTQFYMQAIGFVLSVISFYFFLVSFLQVRTTFIGLVSLSGVPVAVLATILVLTGQFIDWNEGQWAITPVGYILFVLGIGYLLTAFWMIYRENTQASRVMRLPALLMILGIASNFVPALSRLPIDTTARSLVMILVGWQILRFQLFNPIHDMNVDLKAKNEELQKTAEALKSEKARVDELNQQLRQANQYKDTFLASMSHELRTPLNAVIGYSELLMQGTYGDISDKQRNRIEKIYMNGSSLLELINDILDLSKIEAGKIELDLEQLALPQVIQNLRPSIEYQAEKKNLRFTVIEEATLPSIYGDSTRIQQILLNLLSNAVKFTKAGEITVKAQKVSIVEGRSSLNLPAVIKDGEWVLASVQDTGIGIAKENHERIFEAFRQADGSTTREYGGTGLGLAIARRFAEMHGGTIWLESEVGKGSTFHLILPAMSEMAIPKVG